MVNPVQLVDQAGLINTSGSSSGIAFNLGAVNYSGKFSGLRIGAMNISDKSDGVSIGVVNRARDLNGMQVGLLNYSENAFFPIMIGMNANVCRTTE